jgi:hypothetical protein
MKTLKLTNVALLLSPRAAREQKTARDLTEASLEDLMTFSKKEQKLSQTTAAAYVVMNLQGGRHTEFVSIGPSTRATIGRSFFVKLTWGF